MPKLIKDTTRSYLEAASLPSHGNSYTVIPHKDVIENTLNMLNASGFTVTREMYRANINANVAQGIYHIIPTRSLDDKINKESELGMMFAWTNSYDKTTRFQCAVGAYVGVCYNGMVSGDMMNFARKHTGSADYEVRMQISNQIKNAEKHYRKMIDDKDSLKQVQLSFKEQSELLGRLYADEELLDVGQLTTVKSEMKDPSYEYEADAENAWTFYNHVTHALKKTHPRHWLSSTQKFHDFMVADLLGQMGLNSKDQVSNVLVINPDVFTVKTHEPVSLNELEEDMVNVEFDSETV